jgi:hypothetical protein
MGNVFKDNYQLENMDELTEDFNKLPTHTKYLFYSRFKRAENEIDERQAIIDKYFTESIRSYHDVTIINEQLAVVKEFYKDRTLYYGVDRTRNAIPRIAFQTFNEALIYAIALSAGNEDQNTVKYINSIINTQ